MLKKTRCVLFILSALFSNYASAASYDLHQGLSVDLEFPSHDPQILTNYMFWAMTATCKMHTPDASNELFIVSLKKQGKVNGKKVSKDNSVSVIIHTGDIMEIKADSGATFKITNLGENLVKAHCKT